MAVNTSRSPQPFAVGAPTMRRSDTLPKPYSSNLLFLNELGASADYGITQLGGTVTEVATRGSHNLSGTNALRINRTGTTRIDATKSSTWGTARRISGYTWLWADALPSANIVIVTIVNGAGDNFEVRLSNTGALTMGRQNSTGSTASATLITTGSWFKVSWWVDESTAAFFGEVAVNDDTPVRMSWTSGVGESPAEFCFGTRLVTTASTYDLYFDDGELFTGWFQRSPIPGFDPPPLVITLESDTSAGTSTATATNLVILQPFPTTVILDDFNRADTGPPPSGNWTTNLTNNGHGLQVVSNQLANVSATGDQAEGYWSAASYGPDVDVYLTIANKPTSGTGNRSSINELYGRVSNPGVAVSAYGARYRYIDDGTDQATFSVVKYLSGTQTLLITTSRVTALAIGDKFGLRVVGTSIQVWAKNGAGAWTMMTSATDPDVTGAGRVGFHSSITLYTGNLLWDDLGAGTYTSVYTLESDSSVGSGTASAAAFRIKLPNQTSAGVGTTTAQAFRIKLPTRTSAGASTATAAAFRIKLPNLTSVGVGTLAANNVKIKLPTRTSAGTSTATATALRLGLHASSAGTSTATAQAFRIKLPNLTSVGTGTLSANNIKIRLPVRTSAGVATATAAIRLLLPARTSAGTSTSTATALRIRLPSRTSAGTATATAVAFRDRFPNVTSAGVGTLAGNNLKIRLPNRTSAGVGTVSANNVKIQLPARTSAGVGTADETALQLTGGGAAFPAVTSVGTSTATATAFRIRLPNRTAAGVGTLTANNVKIKLPSRTSAGTATATTSVAIRLPARTSAGSSTATAVAFRIKLPNQTSIGVGTLSANNIKIRLPSRTSVGTSTATATALRLGLHASSAGTSTATAIAFRIRLPNLTSAGVGTLSANNVKIRLPNRTSAGVGTTSQSLRLRLPVRTTAGVGTIAGNNLKIRLPNRTSAGVGTATATALAGAVSNLSTITSAGTSTATAQGLRIRLPARSTAGTGALSGSLRIQLPAVTSAGSTGAAANIQLAFDHGTTGSASASTSLDIPTTQAVQAGNYLVLTAATSSGTATISSIAVQTGVDPGNLSWTHYDAVANATGAFVAFTRCPTGVNNGVTFRITWTGVAFGTRRAGLSEWSGLASASVEDSHNTATALSSGDPTVNITTANANDLVIAGLAHQSATSYTPNGTFIELHDDNGGSRTHGTIYQIESSTSTYAPGADALLNNLWSIAVVSLKAAGTGSTVVAQPLNVRLPARTSAGTSSATASAFLIRLPARTSAGVASTTETYTQAVLADAPLSYWHLDETVGTSAADSAGTNTGTYSGVTLNQTSLLPFGGGVSADFGNHVGKVNVADVFDFVGNVPYSVEMWWKPQSIDQSFHTLIAKESAGTRDGWELGYTFTQGNGTQSPTSGHLTWSRWNTNVQQQTTWPTTAATPLIQATRAYHIVALYDGATLKVYVNGVLATTGGAAATALLDTTVGLAIGALNSASGASAQGFVDEVAIYGYALTPSQIKSHYSAANGSSLQIRMPTVSLGGTGTLTQAGIKIQLPSRTSVGTSTATAQGFRVKLPNQISAGNSIQQIIFADFETSNDSFIFSGSGGATGSVTAPSNLYANTGLNSARLVGTGGGVSGLVSARRNLSGLLSFARYRITCKILVESCDTATWTSATPTLVHGGAGGSQTSVTGTAINRTTLGTWQTSTATFVTSSSPNSLGPYFEWVRFNSNTLTGNFAAHGDTVSLELVDAVKPLNVRLPSRTSGGTSTATATALTDRLPSRTSAGTSTATAQGLRIRLPSLTASGTSTATATDLALAGGNTFNVTSRGTSTATAQAFRIRLPQIGERLFLPDDMFDPDQPANTSTGIGTATARITVLLPARTASGSSTTATTFLQVALPSVGERLFGPDDVFDPDQPANTNSGIGTATATGLQIQLPSVSSSGSSTATATAFAEGLRQATSNGVSTATAQAFGIRLPDVGERLFGPDDVLDPDQPANTNSGIGTATAQGLQLRLPSRSTAGTCTSTATALRIRLPSRTSAGTSTATATAYRIRLVPVTVTGTGSLSGNLRIRLPARSTAGTSTATARITLQLPKIGGYGTLIPGYPLDPGTPLLPSGYLGNSTATAQPLRKGLHVFSNGVATATARAFRIRLPANQTHGRSTATIYTLHIFFPPPKIIEASEGQHAQIVTMGQHAITVDREDVIISGLGGHVATAGSGSHTVIERP